jgi:hypothetical protein
MFSDLTLSTPESQRFMISKRKIALIHVAKKELGWNDAEYRHVLRDHGGVESAADLEGHGHRSGEAL